MQQFKLENSTNKRLRLEGEAAIAFLLLKNWGSEITNKELPNIRISQVGDMSSIKMVLTLQSEPSRASVSSLRQELNKEIRMKGRMDYKLTVKSSKLKKTDAETQIELVVFKVKDRAMASNLSLDTLRKPKST